MNMPGGLIIYNTIEVHTISFPLDLLGVTLEFRCKYPRPVDILRVMNLTPSYFYLLNQGMGS